jgi:hypothetical protein
MKQDSALPSPREHNTPRSKRSEFYSPPGPRDACRDACRSVTRPRGLGARSDAAAAPGPPGPCAPSCACRRWGSPGCGGGVVSPGTRAQCPAGWGARAPAPGAGYSQDFAPPPRPPPREGLFAQRAWRGEPITAGARRTMGGRISPVTWRGNPPRPPVPWGKPGPTLGGGGERGLGG